MIELKDGMLLYHGSYTEVHDIDLTVDAIRTLEYVRGERYGDIVRRSDQ